MDLKTSPEDKFLFVQIIFFFLGLGTLLPWNFFITALPYFEGRLSLNVSTSQNSTGPDRDHWHFGNWMTLLSMLPLLLFTCLNSFLYPRVSEKLRIAGSLFAILFLFLVTVIMVKISIPTLYFFIITMSVIWFTNSFGAVLQGSLFGLIGLLPRRYSSVFMSGQGVAGMFAVMASIFAKISGADKEMMALGYFITPCLVILLTIVFYFLLPQLEFAKYHFSKSKQKHSEAESNAELLYQKGIKEDEKNMTSPADVEFCITEVKRGSSVISVFRKIWMMAISVCLVFTVTLSVFPVITVRVGSHTSEGPWKEYFTLVACFLLFNVMDWIGRSVTAVCTWAGVPQGRRDGWGRDGVLPRSGSCAGSRALLRSQVDDLKLPPQNPPELLLCFPHPPTPRSLCALIKPPPLHPSLSSIHWGTAALAWRAPSPAPLTLRGGGVV
ncbi:equilibrative nucleoside transporter 2-like isoform X3 [Narcine bancroftii]|uniref:equilibrative nucleoside transporter 2-like isoform X3 n=1 Tax=Narcine bancroftii TaxID=1343680 RepID=UPI003831A089